jgi:hypothetical protein
MNPVKALQHHGQSIWLDFLARGFGGLAVEDFPVVLGEKKSLNNIARGEAPRT